MLLEFELPAAATGAATIMEEALWFAVKLTAIETSENKMDLICSIFIKLSSLFTSSLRFGYSDKIRLNAVFESVKKSLNVRYLG